MRVLKILAVAAAAVIVATLAAVFWVGANLEAWLNKVQPVAEPAVSARARTLHDASFVADMHADTLMLRDDLLAPSKTGHVDLPRLQAGGVALQFFTMPTRVPLRASIDHTDGNDFDALTLAGFAQRSALFTRGLLGRALLASERLQDAIERANGLLLPVRNQAELATLLTRHAADQRVVGGLLGIEGAHALEDDVANLDVLFGAGFRMIGLAHFFDNAFAGSAHGLVKGGLTPLGRQLVQAMEQRGVLVDVAHLSPTGIDDVLAMVTKPVVASHGGVRGTCDNQRNLSDAHVRGIAKSGGVIGVGYWEAAVCGTEMRHVTAAMRYIIDLVGDDHVGLGSDYDGATTVGFDTSQLAALTQQMLDDGFGDATVRKILGENVLRVLKQTLP
ncbi:MAG: membrane dipeptidase [bacterium]